MKRTLLLLVVLALSACNRGDSVQPARSMPAAPASASATVDGLALQASTVAIADLNPATAQRYGIDVSQEGLLLLVTVRDAAGNGVDPGDLQLTGTAAVLPEPPAPLELRAMAVDGMTDYLGIVHAHAPASVQFRLAALRGGARADIATTAELQPR